VTDTVTIIDYGGTLGSHIALGKAYAAAGVHVAVRYCASACLMLLAQLPQTRVCYYPDIWIGSHSAAWTGGAENPATMDWERGRDLIARGARECGK
jgi:hypothetical protein